MELEHHTLYAAFASKDVRFDGRFFVGVKSTGIYCRPVCRARMPKEENCRFFHTAAAAEKAGFRPCLICRPELAPELSATNAKTVLAKQAARDLEETCGDGDSLKALAARLGYTDRHLRRVFAEEYHVSPTEYLQTCRLLLAKKLLTDTDLTMLAVAMASGFGSLRRFNALFQTQYHLSPSAFRKQAGAGALRRGTITVGLGYQPPYAWERIAAFLASRAIPGVERVSDGSYSRTVRLEDRHKGAVSGWITVSNRAEQHSLAVTLSESLLPVLPQVLSRVKNLFDLHCEPYAIEEKLANDAILRAYVPGLRVPGCFEPFELCVGAILGQQRRGAAAGALAGKLAQSLGQPVQTDVSGLDHTFPTPEDILRARGPLEETLGALGVPAAKAGAIASVAQKLQSNALQLGVGAVPDEVKAALLTIPGVGAGTADYMELRALGDPDAFPARNPGIQKALGTQKTKEIIEISKQWKPWRSYAAVALWDALAREEQT